MLALHERVSSVAIPQVSPHCTIFIVFDLKVSHGLAFIVAFDEGQRLCGFHGVDGIPVTCFGCGKAGQVLKWGGGGVEMVIGWICSRDLFETSWEGSHELLPIVIAEESRMFTVCAFIASVVLLS